MTATKLRRPRRPKMRQAVVIFPSGLTLGNLFFGVFAIITASRGNFRLAGIYVLVGGIFDAFDGRVARATNAGSQFGEELDSLVDAISFGLAPAMIMYFAVLNREGWDWIFVFLFAACAVMRLARFNIEQAGTAKTYFQGLPSPAAGCTLASYYWFSQSWLYNYGAIGNLPWQELLRFLMVALAALMISNVPYPTFPRTGLRSLRAAGATLLLIVSVVLLVTKRLEFFFPLTLVYVAWGLLRSAFFFVFERRQPTIPYDLSEGEDGEDEEEEEFELGTSQVHASRQGTRHTRDDRPQKPDAQEDTPSRPPRTEERPARPDRAERGDRPQRTEAERAARRDKREKRDKREGRPARTPRPPRTDALAVVDDVTSIAGGDLSPDAPMNPDVIGSIPADAETLPAAGDIDASPARKRKRRRRRGERKERGPVDRSAAERPESGDEGSAGDDDSPYGAANEPPTTAAPPAPAPTPSPEPHV